MTDPDRIILPLPTPQWTDAQKAEFIKRRRGRNWALLAAMVGLCALIYAIAVVRLYHAGHMW